MSILICPTAFKGTLSAAEAADAMARGAAAVRGVDPARIVRLPLSDGGNGLLDAVRALEGGELREARVSGPIGDPVDARWLRTPLRAVVETAEACGLHLVPPDGRDPLAASTAGVGELLLEAVRGLDERTAPGEQVALDEPHGLLVGLGGSATVDAGAGMARALGFDLLDDSGDPIPPGGAGLLRLRRIVPPTAGLPVRGGRLTVIADVENPLLGEDGAARVYGPQKGASPDDVEVLEQALSHWADIVERELGRDVRSLAGAGAAGGLGAAFAALLDSPPRPGAEWLLDAVGFDAVLASARAVVTGEGSWDAQSSMGKVTGEVVQRSVQAGVPVLVVAGMIRGRLPAGVHGVAGSDGEARAPVLDAEGLAEKVRAGLAGLLAGGDGP